MITTEAANYIDGLKKFLEFYDMDENLHDGEIDEFNYNSKEGLNMLIWHRCNYIRLKFIGTLNITMCDSEFCPGYVTPNSSIRDFTANVTNDKYQPLEIDFDLVGITIKCERMEIIDVYPDPDLNDEIYQTRKNTEEGNVAHTFKTEEEFTKFMNEL